MIVASQMGASPVGVIFISHSSRNGDEAVAVRDWLRGEGYAETFLDLDPQHGLAPGQRWEEELQRAGERCTAVVVLISPDWCASKWCFHEFKFAKALGKKIFPVLIQPTPWGELPLELTSHFQMANISSPELREDGLTRLRFGLQRAGLDPKHFRLPEGRPPYRGLKALEEEDAAIFFGRDAQITAGLDALRQMRGGTPQRILTIAAASGAGKSSFLKAGLLARLRRDEENFLVLPTWRPGRDALFGETGLANAFGGTAPHAATEALASRQAVIVARFQSMAAAANETWRGTPPSLVLPLDQAEEFFSADNASAPAAIQLLLDVLASKPDLIVAATIRSDALGSLQADSRLAAQLRLFNLPALPPSAFRDVIEGPARLTDPPIAINPALTDRLIADLDKADALPLLAFTLERLVTDYGRDRTLSLQEYETGLGGVSGAINAAVEAALQKAEADPALPSTRHELDSLARAAFIPWLVQLDEADASPKRRVARLSDIPEASRPLIGHFIEERLLVASESAGESVVEVSHEAVLRHWQNLADWVADEHDVLVILGRVVRSANEWANADDFESNATVRSEYLLVHRGNRLQAAEALTQRIDLAPTLQGITADYLKACRRAEDAAAEREEAQQERLLRITARAFAKPAEQACTDGQLDKALRYAAAGAHLTAGAKFEHVGELWRAVSVALGDFPLHGVMRHDAPISGAIFSPDGTRVLTWSEDTTARMWNSASATKVFADLKHDTSVSGALFSSDGAFCLTWNDCSARIWSATTGTQIGSALFHPDRILGARISDDCSRIVTWSFDQTAQIWDSSTGAPASPPLKHKGRVYGANFSNDGKSVLTFSSDGTARLWNALSGQPLGQPLRHKGEVVAGVFSRDGRLVITSCTDHYARLWDTATGRKFGTPMRHKNYVRGAVFSSDDNYILTWGGDQTARLWAAAAGRQIGPDLEHSGEVWSATFSEDGTRILTTDEVEARLWDTATGKQIGESLRHTHSVSGAAFSRDGSRILTWSTDGAKLWDARTAKEIGPCFKHDGFLRGAVFSPDETQVLTWSDDGTARLWGAASNKSIGTALYLLHLERAISSEDGTRVLIWGRGDLARLWDSETGTQIEFPLKNAPMVRGAAFSRNATHFVTWSDDDEISVWDADAGPSVVRVFQIAGRILHAIPSNEGTHCLVTHGDWQIELLSVTGFESVKLLGQEGTFCRAAFLEDQSFVVTWSRDGIVKIWSVRDGLLIWTINQYLNVIEGVAFSRSSDKILIWNKEAASMWSAISGSQISPEFKHEHSIEGAAISRSGSRIVTWSTDKTARIWDAFTGNQIGPSLRHDGSVLGATFSNDESRVLSWSYDSAVLWDAATALQIGSSLDHEFGVSEAAFLNDESRILTWSERNARLWDVSRSLAFKHGPRILLCAALANGIGFRSDKERRDLLLAETSDDLFGLSIQTLGEDQLSTVHEVAALLRSPLHPNCYLSPSDDAQKYKGLDEESAERSVHIRSDKAIRWTLRAIVAVITSIGVILAVEALSTLLLGF